MVFKSVLLLGFLSVTLGCSPASLSRNGLRKYMNDERNGVRKEALYEDSLKLEAYLVRPELIAAVPKVKDDSLKYFILAFSRKGQEALAQYAGQPNYESLIENLSFKAPVYCKLIVDGKDTVAVNNYSFTNNYGIAPANNLLLVFRTALPEESYELDLEDPGFHIPDSKFVFKKNDINTYYKIKID